MNKSFKNKVQRKIFDAELKHNIKQVVKGNPRSILERIRGDYSTVSSYGRLQAQDKRVLYSRSVRNRYLSEICSGRYKELDASIFKDLFWGLVDYTCEEIDYFSDIVLESINLDSNNFDKSVMESIIKNNSYIFTESELLKRILFERSSMSVNTEFATQTELSNFKKDMLNEVAIRLANDINDRFPDLVSSLRNEEASSVERCESIMSMYELTTGTISSGSKSKESREAWINQYLLYKLDQQPKDKELWLVTIIELTSSSMNIVDEIFPSYLSHKI